MTGSARWLVPAAIILSLVQVASVGSRIVTYEDILAHGKRYLFKTAPVDPYDLFRGRYVALSQENLEIMVTEKETKEYERGGKAWVTLKTGEGGYTTFAGISKTPSGGEELKVEVAWAGPRYAPPPRDGKAAVKEQKEWSVHIKPPFDRYYMNEKLAPEAEAAYRNRGEGKINPYIAVRIKNGRGVIEELFIDGKPVGDWIKGKEEKQ